MNTQHIDVSSIAQPREAAFPFDLICPVTSTMLRMVLARLFQNRGIDAASIAVSPEDYRDLTEEMVGNLDPILHPVIALKIANELTGTFACVVVNSDLSPGRVVFGVLYGQ